MRAAKGQLAATENSEVTRDRPLSALLSQLLVAFTIEFDNEFERRMREAGYPGAVLSLVVWSNLVRFLAEGPISVHDLAAHALATEKQIKFELGCLERWGFIVLQNDPSDTRPIPMRAHSRANRILRDGWGSGRGIRSSWMVHLTRKGLKAREIWPPLFGAVTGLYSPKDWFLPKRPSELANRRPRSAGAT